MSQNAYALFQTIKTIKGHTMINTYTMTERRQEKEQMKIGIATSNTNSLTAYNEHTTLTSMASDATSLIVPAGPYTHIRIHPLLLSWTTSAGIRVTGWSKIKDSNTYVPSLLFAGSIAGVQATASITNNSVNLKFVHGITVSGSAHNSYFPSNYLGAQTLINNSAILSVASIVVPQFGCSYIECDFVSATATSAYANILYTYCSI